MTQKENRLAAQGLDELAQLRAGELDSGWWWRRPTLEEGKGRKSFRIRWGGQIEFRRTAMHRAVRRQGDGRQVKAKHAGTSRFFTAGPTRNEKHASWSPPATDEREYVWPGRPKKIRKQRISQNTA